MSRIFAIWFCGEAVGLDLSPLVYIVMGPLLFLVMMVPFTINGLGVREAFFIAFLGRFGVDADAAFATGFLFYAVTIAASIPGGFILLWESLRPAASRPTAGAPRAPFARVYEGRTVAVVVPAWRGGARRLHRAGRSTAFVDRIYVVDDGSKDATAERAQNADKRVESSGTRRPGRRLAIVTGYKRALAEEMDVTCVMAADGQMDPDDLETLVRCIATGETDYAKANRLFTGRAWRLIPRTRYLGNAALSFPDEDRLRLLARGRLAVRLHGRQPRSPQAAGSRSRLPPLRLPQRLPRPSERLQPPRSRLPLAADLRRGERSGIKLQTWCRKSRGFCSRVFFWRMGQKYVIPRLPPAHPLLHARDAPFSSQEPHWASLETVMRFWGTQSPPRRSSLSPSSASRDYGFSSSPWFDAESNKDLR